MSRSLPPSPPQGALLREAPSEAAAAPRHARPVDDARPDLPEAALLRLEGRRERWIVALATVGLTTFFALLYALRAGIAALDRGESVRWGGQVWSSLAVWWACLPLVPVMAWLVRTFPAARRHWARNLGILVMGTLCLAVVRQVLVTPVVVGITGMAEAPGSDVARTLSYFATFLVVGGLLHAVYFYRGLRAREVEAARLAQSLAEARLATLRAQLQPHFLFNTLNAIAALLHQDPLLADRMLTRLAALLRSALRPPPGEVHPLRDELAVLDQYLDVMALRFGDRLRVERAIDPALLDQPVPWMVLQPLVENALEHGLGARAAGGTLRLTATVQPGGWEFTVEDDGAGLAPPAAGVPAGAGRGAFVPADGEAGGIGVENTRRRLQQLHGDGASLRLVPRTSGGTRAIIRLPIAPRGPGARAGAVAHG